MRSSRAVRGKTFLRRKDCSLHASATYDCHAQTESAAKLGSHPSSGTSLLHGPEGAQFSAGTAKLSAHTPPTKQVRTGTVRFGHFAGLTGGAQKAITRLRGISERPSGCRARNTSTF